MPTPTDTHLAACTSRSRTPPGLRLAAPFRAAVAMMAAARQRRHLARLDDHLLRDIGLSRSDALAEIARPVWDAPSHWSRDRPPRG